MNTILSSLFGITFLFFFLWKRLKDDYHYEKIFNLGFLIVGGLILGFTLSKYLFPSFWFWSELLGVGLTFAIVTRKQKIKFFEALDGLVIGFLPWLGLHFMSDAVAKSSLASFLAFWVCLILIFLFFFVDSQYRRFSWYKSGRVGFSGVFILILFFSSRVASAIIFPSIISIAGRTDAYISSVFILTFLILLYRLSKSSS